MKDDVLLSTLAQIAVALAGFSGIVVALGGRAHGEWSSRDRRLLTALLGTSGGSALLCVPPLLLASAQLPERTIWVVSSGCAVVLQGGLMAIRAGEVAKDRDTRAREPYLLVVVFSAAVAFAVLQLANVFWLGVAWPHLSTIAWHLVVAFVVFVRLVLPIEA
jgi:hypothetical protein